MRKNYGIDDLLTDFSSEGNVIPSAGKSSGGGDADLPNFSKLSNGNDVFELLNEQKGADAEVEQQLNNKEQERLKEQQREKEEADKLEQKHKQELEEVYAKAHADARVQMLDMIEQAVTTMRAEICDQLSAILINFFSDVVKKHSINIFIKQLDSIVRYATTPLVIEGSKDLLEEFKALVKIPPSKFKLQENGSNELCLKYNEEVLATNMQSMLEELGNIHGN